MRLLGATGVEVAPTLPEPELIPEAVETAFYRAACGEDRDQFVEQVEKCFSKQALHTHSFEHLRAVFASAGRGLEAARGFGIDGFAAGESDGVADLAELDSLESAKSYLVDRFDSRRAGGGDRSGSLVKLAQAFIKEHYHEDVDMTAVADYLGLSYSYFGRLFKKEMGRNFFSYLCEVRLRKAMELLQDPRLSVGEVAAKVGYTNRKTFVRQFKKQFGTVPSERRGAER
jgi:AraC-like DNA-binding protein